MKVPFFRQLNMKDCGPTCLKMIASFYGKHYAIDFLRDKCSLSKSGVSMRSLSDAAETIGFRATGVKLTQRQLIKFSNSIPLILHWSGNHFVVVYGYKKSLFNYGKFRVYDPEKGEYSIDMKGLMRGVSTGQITDDRDKRADSVTEDTPFFTALILETTPEFFQKDVVSSDEKLTGFKFLFNYFKSYQYSFIQLSLGLIIGIVITLISPLLTQTLIDKGVNLKNYSMIHLVIAGQVVLLISTIFIEFLRGRILLHVGSRINISMVSDFFYKLFLLPISFFEKHVIGDILQRISDFKRLENLLTVSSLTTIFSFINMIILVILLGTYQLNILIVFLVGAIVGLIWTLFFLRWKERIDYKMFSIQTAESTKVIGMIDSIHDLKISNSATKKRHEWEDIQGQLFSQKLNNLNASQLQNIGALILSQSTNILISYLSAKSVVDGEISLGAMFAINMIIGQLYSPLQQIYTFINTLQQAKIGLNRIGDILLRKNEIDHTISLIKYNPSKESINFDKVSFSYSNDTVSPTLKNISFSIPSGKVTAIVGASGSGKSTILKLLLRFYDPSSGNIFLDKINFNSIDHNSWRANCGVVLQDGKLFDDTIAENITSGQEFDFKRVITAGRDANLEDFVSNLPKGYFTEIGGNGIQLSAGQKQRILLARAIYKKPEFLFLDEATSALDSSNEMVIMKNLATFYTGRTVVIIAHRLSTVRDADQIIVMEKGEIVEIGSHESLVSKQGKYFELVKNQLNLID